MFNFSFDGNNFGTVADANYHHGWPNGLGNYRGNAFVTGCDNPGGCEKKTEILDLITLTWSDAPDYPYLR